MIIFFITPIQPTNSNRRDFQSEDLIIVLNTKQVMKTKHVEKWSNSIHAHCWPFSGLFWSQKSRVSRLRKKNQGKFSAKVDRSLNAPKLLYSKETHANRFTQSWAENYEVFHPPKWHPYELIIIIERREMVVNYNSFVLRTHFKKLLKIWPPSVRHGVIIK